MTTNQKPQLHLSSPKDRSFEAYRDWINKMGDALKLPPDDSSVEELQADWKEFWESYDAKNKV